MIRFIIFDTKTIDYFHFYNIIILLRWNGGSKITIDKCPVVEYMRGLNQEPSEYFIEETRTVYKTVADLCSYKFNLEHHNDDGATKFTFTK